MARRKATAAKKQSGRMPEPQRHKEGEAASAELRKVDYAALAQAMLQAIPAEISGKTAASKAGAGSLVLVATPIGHRGDITLRALVTLAQADLILCEDTRQSGALLRAYGIATPLLSYNEHNAAAREAEILDRLQRGACIALVSDAGTPVISDPGWRLVSACRAADLAVTACPGPVAQVTGLVVSGLPPQPYLFAGFLPARAAARRQELAPWAALPATLVFYEAPSRLAASLADMLMVCGDRPAAVARELTKLHEECRVGSLSVLAAHYAVTPPKGELIVLLGPATVQAAAFDDVALTALLQPALQLHSLRDAVISVAAQTGVARDRIYQLALRLRRA